MAKTSQNWLNGLDNVTLDIAAVFASNYSIKTYGSEIAKDLDLPQRTVSRKLNILTKIGVLTYMPEGRNKLYSLNKNNPLSKTYLTFLETYKAICFFLKWPKIALMLESVLKECGCVVFGSYAAGNPKGGSDLDLLFFSKKESKVKEALKTAFIEVHAQFLSYNEFNQSLKNKKTLATEIAFKHIILNDFDNIINLFWGYYLG